MQFRKLGNTDLEVSVVAFGAWAAGGWMWGGTERAEAIDAIRAAYDEGVTSIDTAPIYGQGTSEEIVGEAIKDIQRDKVQILTKFGLRWDTNEGEFYFNSENNDGKPIDIYRNSKKDSIIKECEDSLRRLGTDYIDLYQIHRPDPTTPIQETMEAVAKLIEQGKVRYAGVSNYDVAQFKEAEKYVNVISNQVPYSMVLRDIEEDMIPYLVEKNKSVVAYSPLQRGLLTGKMKPGYKFGEGDHRAGQKYFTDENLTRTNAFLDSIKPIAVEKGLTVSQLVIGWTIAQPAVDTALVGARNAEQSVQNAKAGDVKLTAEEVKFINDELKKLQLV